jgi:aldehyde:ferredoxin oxidoreductase
MPFGFCGKILHVDLNKEQWVVEEPSESFYRMYMGGSAMGAYYLLKLTPRGADPLGPENTLCLMTGPTTGAPFSGQSRVTATAKSPYTDLVGDSQSGGFWPVELKAAGFDGIVIRGRAESPRYLWIKDGEVELRDATHLRGMFSADVEESLRSKLEDLRIQVLQCGPAAERGVRFGALISMSNRANGRTGMGTVMASKNLRAVVVRGHSRPIWADSERIRALAKWGAENLETSGVAFLKHLGTAGVVQGKQYMGDLPSYNWTSGVFEGAENISGETLTKTILKERDTCFGCVVRCKPVVEVKEGPYIVDSRYGGPEYETIATFGAYCGVSDLSAIAYADQLCSMHGMDTISCGATVAWAMDCFEHGLLTKKDTAGLDLHFGNAAAMVSMVEQIANREGLGEILGEGSVRAAEILGFGKELVVAVKKSEMPAHAPEVKRSLALIYAVNPFGADHKSHEHDPAYGHYTDRMAELGLTEPYPMDGLNPERIRYALYTQYLYSCLDSLCLCLFVFGPAWQLYGPCHVVEALKATTGWNVSLWELMKVGERRLNMLRAFNSREGVGSESDTIPPKLMIPFKGGASDGFVISQKEMADNLPIYYQMAGWDENGHPTRTKLTELGLSWLADELEASRR